MLAQNFKTPADLGITDAEFDALAKVLGMLERGELDGKFNMWMPSDAHECGTATCICGWARRVAKNNMIFRALPRPKGLSNLFWMGMVDAKTAHAIGRLSFEGSVIGAIALRNYLTHGEPRWEEALA